mgnify:CR=1 FL=1
MADEGTGGTWAESAREIVRLYNEQQFAITPFNPCTCGQVDRACSVHPISTVEGAVTEQRGTCGPYTPGLYPLLYWSAEIDSQLPQPRRRTRMQAIHCDRCRAVAVLGGNGSRPDKWLVLNIGRQGIVEGVSDKELCPKCAKALSDWLKPLPVGATI